MKKGARVKAQKRLMRHRRLLEWVRLPFAFLHLSPSSMFVLASVSCLYLPLPLSLIIALSPEGSFVCLCPSAAAAAVESVPFSSPSLLRPIESKGN